MNWKLGSQNPVAWKPTGQSWALRLQRNLLLWVWRRRLRMRSSWDRLWETEPQQTYILHCLSRKTSDGSWSHQSSNVTRTHRSLDPKCSPGASVGSHLTLVGSSEMELSGGSSGHWGWNLAKSVFLHNSLAGGAALFNYKLLSWYAASLECQTKDPILHILQHPKQSHSKA